MLLCLALAPSTGAAAAPTPLPELSGATYSSAQSVNNRGDVAGYSGTADGSAHAVLWTGGAVQDLGTIAGDLNSYASGVNDRREVVGYSISVGGHAHAFVFRDGTMTALPMPAGFTDSLALAINNRGQIVGWGNNGAGEPRPLLWFGTSVVELATLPGAAFGDARSINNRGQIVGSSDTGAGSVRAVLWQNGVIESLGGAAGDSDSYANAIADGGQIAGMGAATTFVFHPLEWSRPAVTPDELGSSPSIDTSALGINERGWAVGYAGFPAETEAVLWHDGDVTELGPGLAFAINASGAVAGQSGLRAVVWQAGPDVRRLAFRAYGRGRLSSSRR